MSEENVEAFKRAIEAANRQDVEALLEEVDPEAEWPHPGFHVALGGGGTMYRGHEGVRKVFINLYEVFAEVQVSISGIRDLGDRIVVTGGLWGRGTERTVRSPIGGDVTFRSGSSGSLSL